MDKNIYNIYTDGSARGGGEVGGWAFAVYKDDELIRLEYKNDVQNTTNNREELKALINALSWTLENTYPCDNVTIYCDSSYVVNMFNDWILKMASRGWKKADGKTPENLDLLREMVFFAQIGFPNFTVAKVPGHAGIEGNEIVDAFAAANHKKINNFVANGYLRNVYPRNFLNDDDRRAWLRMNGALL